MAAVDDPEVTDGMLRMLNVLGAYANKDGWCWPKLETLAKRRRMEKPAVSKLLRRLREAGYLEVHYEIREGRRRCVFRVLFDRPVSTAADITEDEYASGLEGEPRTREATALVSPRETEARARVSRQETGGAVSVSTQETDSFLLDGNGPFPPGGNGPLMNSPVEQSKGTSAARAAARVVDLWNQIAVPRGLPKARLTAKRERAIGTRLREAGWLADFERACAHVAATPFYRGVNERGWVATLDFVLQAGRATELAERAQVPTIDEAEPAGGRPGPTRPRPAVPGVPIGGRTWSGPALWDLFVRGGFTAPMQTRETLAERAQVLARDGQIPDADAFLALVLHVKPWALAEIKFAKSREERLLEILATFRALAQGAA